MRCPGAQDGGGTSPTRGLAPPTRIHANQETEHFGGVIRILIILLIDHITGNSNASRCSSSRLSG